MIIRSREGLAVQPKDTYTAKDDSPRLALDDEQTHMTWRRIVPSDHTFEASDQYLPTEDIRADLTKRQPCEALAISLDSP